MPGWTRQWLHDTGLLVVAQVFVLLTSTAVAIILARSLGPSEWGLFAALFGLNAALSIFVNLGLGTWLLRELSRLHHDTKTSLDEVEIERSRKVVGAIFANLIFGTLLFVATVIVLALLDGETQTSIAFLALIVSTIVVAVSNCLEAFLRAERDIGNVVIANVLDRGLLTVFVACAAMIEINLAIVGIAYLLASVARVMFVGFAVFVTHGLRMVVPAIQDVRRVVVSGVPFAFNTLALTVIPRLDPVIVALVSVTAAGYFALGDRLVGPALIVPVVASTALYPFLAGERPTSTAVWRISGLFATLGLAVSVIGVILAPTIVAALFGDSYEDAVPIVQLMLCVLPFTYVSNPLLAHLYSSGRERKVFGATIFASVIGTAAIAGGMLVLGVIGAGAGYVLRQALFTATLVAMALSPRGARRRAYEKTGGD